MPERDRETSSRHWLWLCALALPLAACGSGAETPGERRVATAEVRPTDRAEAVEDGVAEAPASSSATAAASPPPRAPLAPEQRRQVREHLRAGRVAAREGRNEEALADLRAALAIDASNRRLRCETGYVAFLAGHRDEARGLIDGALAGVSAVTVPHELRAPYAMCLYNTGLVRHAAGDIEGARQAFAQSLDLRENAAVQRQLASLPPASGSDPGLQLDPHAPMADIVRALWAHYQASDDEDADLDESDPAPEESRDLRRIDGSGSLEAYLLELTPTLSDSITVLIIRTGAQIAAFEVLNVYDPGQLGMWADGDVESAEIADVVPGGLPELVVRTTESFTDDDLGGCVNYSGSTASTIVCTTTGTIACGVVPTVSQHQRTCDECVADWGERCGQGGRPVNGSDGYGLELTFDAGRVHVALASSNHRLPPAGLVGDHDLAALIASSPLPPLR